ncbi:MAG: antibiotic biosynthesis monooxygenase [Rhizobiales bacterium]|nr:antibiotic biosynthesis monooxygenase [Hyphomicrobiales bacterium]
MIVEHAILNVKPGQAAAFEQAMQTALPLISATPGFLGLEVRPCLETTGRYLLLVRWETLEAHTEGFRGSNRYEKWRALLHGFYDPFPLVEHYGEPIAGA